jgi:hypothetical protein
MSNENFYSNLPVLDDFTAVTDLGNYQPLPEDWWIVVADIANSTGAIRSGMYKAVNLLGVSVITSVVNLANPLLIPYIFGGDGAVMCVPPGLLDKTRTALLATQALARATFGLDLRAGLIPISAINRSGARILVARHRMSRHFIQTAFAGGGVEYAERLLKDETAGAEYRLPHAEASSGADFSGLECRWDNVPSKHGEIIALIVKAMAPTLDAEARIYDEIIAKVKEIYGDDDSCRPVHLGGLHLTFNGGKLSHETWIRTFPRGLFARLRYWYKVRLQNVLGWIFMGCGFNIGGTDWVQYKQDLILNTDFKKFDGMLRAVLSGTREQRWRLNQYLEARFDRKECVYGIHPSDSALITCLIRKRSGEHYHFVDGADGGYAMAAAALKDRLKELNSPETPNPPTG